MTDLITITFVDEDGVRGAISTRRRSSTTRALLAAAGNETTTRLIGWTGYLLAKHPDAARAAL